MNMIVCVKQVLDPEAPPSSFKIDPATNKLAPTTSVPSVISPFDEQAVEAALKIKDAKGGKITVISLGVNLLRDVVKKPLSLGADELILLEDPAFVDGDSWSTAYALAAAIKKVGQFDLIFLRPSGSRFRFRSGRCLHCRNSGTATGNSCQENRDYGWQGEGRKSHD